MQDVLDAKLLEAVGEEGIRRLKESELQVAAQAENTRRLGAVKRGGRSLGQKYDLSTNTDLSTSGGACFECNF